MSKATEILHWLHSPSVRIYTYEERLAHARERSQTAEEACEAARMYPVGYYQRHRMSPEAVQEADAANDRARQARREYRIVPERTLAETEELLTKQAKRAAGSDYLRTDPWKGIDTNPWKITEAERRRLGLGRFR
jgi:hypothetical protein